MAASFPTYVAKGAFASGTAGITPGLPAGIINDDILILVVESANQAITAPSGWTEVGNQTTQSTGTAAAAGGVRLGVFWRVVGGLETAPTVADTGDHTTGIIFAVRGADPQNPFNQSASSAAAANTAMTWPSLTTTTANTLILMLTAVDTDAAATTNVGAITAASLTGITEIHDESVIAGAGGGVHAAYGNLASAGSTGSMTATGSTSVTHAYLTLAVQAEDPKVRTVGQYKNDQLTVVPVGGATGTDGISNEIFLKAEYSAGNRYNPVTPKYEKDPVGTGFTGTADAAMRAVTQLDATNPARALRGATMVYDDVNKRLVYFGGYDGTTRYNEVWHKFIDKPGQPWRKMTTLGTAPAGRNLHGSTFLKATLTAGGTAAYMMVWGGFTTADQNDMWLLRLDTVGSETWTQVTQTSAPTAREYMSGHIVATPGPNSHSAYVYLFGGWATNRENQLVRCTIDVDAPTTTTWTTLKATGTAGNPTIRTGAIMAYKASTSKLYLYGGYSGTAMLNDFWEYDIAGNSWSQRTVTGTAPTASETCVGGYDAANNRFWFTGGWTTNGTFTTGLNQIGYISNVGSSEAYNIVRANTTNTGNQTYVGNSFGAAAIVPDKNFLYIKQGANCEPSATDMERYGYIIDFNEGVSSNYPVYGDNEGEFNTARDAPAGVYDPVTGEWLMIGGFDDMYNDTTIVNGTHSNDIWAYNPTTNTWRYANANHKGLPPMEGRTAVYDSTRDRFVLFGGLTAIGLNSDEAWQLTRTSNNDYVAAPLYPSGTKPADRWLHAAVYDPANDRMIIALGGDNTGPNSTVWALNFSGGADGAWTQLTPTGSVTAVAGMGFANKASAKRLYIFGGATNSALTVVSGQLAYLDYSTTNCAWVTVTTTGGVSRRTPAMAYDKDMDRLVVFGGYNGSASIQGLAYLNLATTVWEVPTISGTLPDARRSAIGEVINGVYYLTHGRSDSGMWYRNTWSLRPDYATINNGIWSKLYADSYNPVYYNVTGLTTSTGYHWQAWVSEGVVTQQEMLGFENTNGFYDGTNRSGVAQGYTAASNMTISGIAVRNQKVGSPTDSSVLTLRSGSVTGTVLATASALGSTLSTTYAWQNYMFPTDVQLTNGSKYYIVMTRSGANDATNFYYASVGTGSSYSGGGYLFNSGTWGTESSTDDMNFRMLSQTDSIAASYPDNAAKNFKYTYYFDGSDAAATDPNSVFTNDANAFDGLTTTYASVTTNGTTASNFLKAEGTNAPSSGGEIYAVRARVFRGGTSGATGTVNAAIYTDSLGQLLGTATAGPSEKYLWGQYVTLSTPSGGWDWTKVGALETKIYATNEIASADEVARVEIEVTTSAISNTESQNDFYVGTPTVSAPTVTASAADTVDITSANANGNVTADGNGAITERGFVLALQASADPTTGTNLKKIVVDGTTGLFTAAFTGLDPATAYKFRPYAINSAGTTYGTATNFTTLDYKTYTLYAVMNNVGGGTTYLALYNRTDGTLVPDSEISTSSPSPVLVQKQLAYNATNFVDAKDYEYRIRVSSGTGNVYSAGLYIKLKNLTKVTTHNRISRFGYQALSAAAAATSERFLYTAGNYSSPSTDWIVTGTEDTNGTNNFQVYNVTTTDSGTTGSGVAGTTIDVNSTSKVWATTTGVTMVDTNRYMGIFNFTSGGARYHQGILAITSTGTVGNIKNQTQIELLDTARSSQLGVNYEPDSSKTPFHTTHFDGATYYFEAIGTNGHATNAYGVTLVAYNAAGVATDVVTQNLTANTGASNVRYRTASITIPSDTVEVRVRIAGTAAAKNVILQGARVIVVQNNPSKTLVHIPMGGSNNESNDDAIWPIVTSNQTGYNTLATNVDQFTIFRRNDASFADYYEVNNTPQYTKVHTTDALRKRQNLTVLHTTDSNRKKSFVIAHQTSSSRWFGKNHTTDALKTIGTTIVTNTYTTLSSADDGQETITGGAMDITSTTGIFDRDHHLGFRFPSVTIPQGTTISAAYIKFPQLNNYSGFSNILGSVYGEKVSNSAQFTTTAGNISGRTKTTAKVTNPSADSPAWSNGNGLDITAVVQEILNQGTWASGNAASILLIGDGAGASNLNITPYMYDYFTGTYKAQLIIQTTASAAREMRRQHTTDAYKTIAAPSFTRTHTTDALKRKQLTLTHTTDANKKKAGNTKFHTTDANKKKTTTISHTTSANLKKSGITRTHTTDANKKKSGITVAHTTDANKKKASLTVSHTTSANKRLATTKTHTTDANKTFRAKAFYDNFNDNSIDATKWIQFSGATESNNKLEIISATTSSYRGFTGQQLLNLTGSEVSAQLVDSGNQAIASWEVYPIQFLKSDSISQNALWWYTNAGLIKAYKKVGGTQTQLFSATYVPTTHQWMRIRESGGTVYWDTSADSMTWTNRATELVSNLFDLTSGKIEISAGTYASETLTTTAKIDNVNIYQPVAVHTTDAYLRTGVQTLTRTHTTDALKRKQFTLTHTTDSNKKKANLTLTHTTDANKKKATTVSHTTSANLKKSGVTRSHTTDANKKISGFTRSHTTDANKKVAGNTKFHTTDANKRIAGITRSHTTDALKRKQFTPSHTTDANKKKANNTVSHTTSANKRVAGNLRTHTTDSFLRKQNTRTHTTDANKRKATTVSHTTDANKRLATIKTHTTDANKKTSGVTRSHTTDALKRGRYTLVHTTDANKKKAGLTLSHTTDALKTFPLAETLIDNFNDNSLNTGLWTTYDGGGLPFSRAQEVNTRFELELGSSATGVLDAAGLQGIKYYSLVGSFVRAKIVSATGAANRAGNMYFLVSGGTSPRWSYNNGQLLAQSTPNGGTSPTTYATLTYSATNHLYWRIRESGGVFYWDTSADGSNWTNQYNGTPTGFASPVKGQIGFEASPTGSGAGATFYIDDVNVGKITTTRTHTTDALKRTQTVKTHTTDANKKVANNTKFHTTSANKRVAAITRSHTTDSLVRKQFTKTHTTDANKRVSGFTRTHTTDANKKLSGFTRTHTTDSLKRKQFTLSHTTDALVRKQFTKTHTTDANKRKATTLSHTTSANKRLATLKTHTTDANKKKAGLTLSHTTSAYINKAWNVGPRSPGTAANDASIGTVAWNNVGNILTSDDTYANFNDINPVTSNFLKATNFGFNIPSNATVKGIVVEIEKKASSNGVNYVQDNRVSIVKSTGAIGTTNKGDTVTKWNTTDTYVAYGSPTDLWGETWAYTDINSANFGAVIAGQINPSTSATGYVDHFRITVYYTTQGSWFQQTQTTDALVRKQTTKTHTTDSLKKAVNTRSHTTDASKKQVFTKSHTTSAYKRVGLNMTIYPSMDGSVKRTGVDETFSTIRNGSGNAVDLTSTSDATQLAATSTSNQFGTLTRGMFTFDTSSIPAEATINSVTLSLYGQSKANFLGTAPDLHVAGASPATPTTLVNSDYANVSRTSFGNVPYASFSTAGYNDIVLNASGLAAINRSGYTSFSTQLAWDLNNSFTGSWSNASPQVYSYYMSEDSGTTRDPKLTINYSLPPLVRHTTDAYKSTTATSGPNSAGTGGFQNDGFDGWSNTGNIVSSNDAYATATVGINAGWSNYLLATNFGFAIPAGSIINGIQMDFERKASTGITDKSIKIIKGGVLTGTDKAAGATWPASDAYASYGSASDLWGTTWTVADINSSNFGVAIQAQGTGGFQAVSVDHVRMTVTWTPGIVANQYTRTFTTDALKRKQFTLTHTTDALKRKANTLTHTTDANKKLSGVTKFHTTDANKKKAGILVSHTTDANKRKAGLTRSHTTDTLIRKQFTKTHTTDALKKKANLTVSHTTDALKRTQNLKTHTTDSFLRKQWTKTHTTDANLKKTTLKTHTTDANKRVSGFTKVHTTDANKKKTTLVSHTTDANKKKSGLTVSHTTSANKRKANLTLSHSTDALKRTQNVKSHTTDAFKRIQTTRSHTTDSFLRKSNTRTHTTDANLKKTNTLSHTTSANKKKANNVLVHTTDANKKRANNTVTHTTDANKRKTGLTVSHTTDSFLRKQWTKVHTTDANKKKSNNTVSHTADANKRKTGNVVSHTTSSFLRKQFTVAHTTDANKKKTTTKTHTTDSFLRKTNTRTHTTDANRRKVTIATHTTDSNKRKVGNVVSHTTDANKRKANNVVTHTTNALLRRALTLSHTTNSFLRRQLTLSHTTDSFLRKTNTRTHTTDANKRKVTLTSHTTDANKRKANNLLTHSTDALKRTRSTISHTTDALKRLRLTLSHTTSSFLRRRIALTHSTDSFLRGQYTRVHTTDANKRKANNVLTHTTDANKRKTFSLSHTTDALKRTTVTRSHTTDSFLRRRLTLAHSTDALKRTINTLTHSTDSFLRGANGLFHSTDANKRKSGILRTHTTDANKKKLNNVLTHTTNALLRRALTLVHTTDANKRKAANTVSHTTNALLRSRITLTHTTDALKRTRNVLAHTTSSVIRKQNTRTHTTDANKKKLTTKFHTTDANKRKLTLVTHTTDANKRKANNTVFHTTSSNLKKAGNVVSHTTNSLLRKTNTVSHATDALKRKAITLVHSTDSFLRRRLTLSHSTDSNKRKLTLVSHLTDANKKRANNTVSHTTSANKRLAGKIVQHSTDANLRKVTLTSHTTDANKKISNNTVEHTTSTYIRGANQLAHNTDANKRKLTLRTHTTDANKKKANNLKSHTTDAFLRISRVLTHTTDANKRRGQSVAHTTSSLLRKLFTVSHSTDANKKKSMLRTHTTDAFLRLRKTVTHTTDALLRLRRTISHTTSANLRKPVTKSHTTNSMLRGGNERYHNTDANLKRGQFVSHTTSANKRKPITISHLTDALLKARKTLSHATDAFLRKVRSVTHTTSANKRKAGVVSHNTDANLKSSNNQVVHTTDASLKQRWTVSHTTDASLKVRKTLSHSTSANKRRATTVSHTTDASKFIGHAVIHSTDAYLFAKRGNKKVLVNGVWVYGTVKILEGGVWVVKPIYVFNGTTWVLSQQ